MMLRNVAIGALIIGGICAQVHAAPATGNWSSHAGNFSVGPWTYGFAGSDDVGVGDTFSAEGLDGCCYLLSGGTLADIVVSGENTYQLSFSGAALSLPNDPAMPWHNAADGGAYVVSDAGLLMDLVLLYDGDALTSIRLDVTGSGAVDGFPGTTASFRGFYEGVPTMLEDPAALSAVLNGAQISVARTAQVAFDIKPASCDNPVNVRSRGVLPVVIAGSETLDVSIVDAASVRLAGIAPLRSAVGDAMSADPEAPCDVLTLDGFPDLVLKFDIQDLMLAVGGYDLDNGTVLPLDIVASVDNVNSLQGSDSVRIINNKVPGNQTQGGGGGGGPGQPASPGSQGYQPTAPGNNGAGNGWGSDNNPSDLLGLGKVNRPVTPGGN